MSLRDKIIEIFWVERDGEPRSSRHLFNYRKIWKAAVLLTGSVSILPLIFITLVDYHVTSEALQAELRLRMARLVSNTGRALSFFLTERKSALTFIARDGSCLSGEPGRLERLLENLKTSFGGGFADLGVIEKSGIQIDYVGPNNLLGKDYSGQDWYKKVLERGVYISDVFLGYRGIPHIVIAVKATDRSGESFVLRSSIYLSPFEELLGHLELAGTGDAFIVNEQGLLQTRSRRYGDTLGRIPLKVPPKSYKTELVDEKEENGAEVLLGYRFIEDTPFVLMMVKNKRDLMDAWVRTRFLLIGFLVASVSMILAVVGATAAYLVKKMKIADEQRLMSFHRLEYSNKMATIGRLAATVAHEINNPLAIINEKAGLIRDLFVIKKQYDGDEKLLKLVDTIIASVQRAGRITKRLLNFAKNFDSSIEELSIKSIIENVLGFIHKDAEIRSIGIKTDCPVNIPQIYSDRGKLQQIFLNIINNALLAMNEGGTLSIRVRTVDDRWLSVSISDTGCGIKKEDLDHIFEPFFSTRVKQGGTGLGLSITYGLVQELGGSISVESEVGKGTTFTVKLPIKGAQDRR